MVSTLTLPDATRAPGGGHRTAWLVATIGCTLGAFAVTIAGAPASSTSPTRALQWLIFVASSVHVASTGWFFTLPEVRAHARAHRGRYVLVPTVLIVATALVAIVVPPQRFTWLLLGFFGWQFFHFQKQNVGMAALAGISLRAGPVTRPERRAIMSAGVAGIAGIMLQPHLLQLTIKVAIPGAEPTAAAGFVIASAGGAFCCGDGRHRKGRTVSPWFTCVRCCSSCRYSCAATLTPPWPDWWSRTAASTSSS